VIYEGHQQITGLAFRLVGKNHVLFVATEGEVLCITLLPKDKELKVCSCSKYLSPDLFFSSRHNTQSL